MGECVLLYKVNWVTENQWTTSHLSLLVICVCLEAAERAGMDFQEVSSVMNSALIVFF